MDARTRLRVYLEQRKELGERELVLDGMSVEQMLSVLGASAPASAPASAIAPMPPAAERIQESQAQPSDWRSTLRAAGSAPPTPAAAPRPGALKTDRPPAKPLPSVPVAPASAPSPVTAPPGLVVGGARGGSGTGPLGTLTSLDAIAAAVATCTRCPLYATAINPVPGEGDPNAGLICVGEAPGASEDETGRPFVGKAGQLLTKILAAINLTREQVFICNVLKHRPPANRNPLPDEVTACSPYLVRQLELIKPKVIVAFGTFAAQTLLETRLGIGQLRGQVHRYHGIPLVVTYHPAALLRNPAWKRPAWEDVQLARRILDSPASS